MKKYLILFSFLLTLNILYSKESKSIISSWESLIRIDEITDEKIIFLSKDTISDSEKTGELLISTSKDSLSIIIYWQNDEPLLSNSAVQYKFDKENFITLTPRNNRKNISILFSIDDIFKVNQEKETIDFIKQMLTYNSLIIRVNSFGELYHFNLDGFKNAIEKTDLSGTLLEQYKNQIIK